VRQIIIAALLALFAFVSAEPAESLDDRCAGMFPDIEWYPVVVDAPVSLATAGMSAEMSERYGRDAERVANRIQAELGGLEDTAMCLTIPEIELDVGNLVASGQRLHVAVFGEEKVFALSAVEIRMVDDAIAFGLPHIALWQLADELGLADGYPEPLASTISHWYLARDNDRLERYHAELVVQLFLDDPNPDLRTAADATLWGAATREDPFTFDPQFVASPMGDLIDYAVAARGVDVLRDPAQQTWGTLENEWRTAMKVELLDGRSGSWGAEWGVAIIVFFVLLAILLAWLKRRERKRAATRRPTPPADESLFVSEHE
jgi:hypothetical protein